MLRVARLICLAALPLCFATAASSQSQRSLEPFSVADALSALSFPNRMHVVVSEDGDLAAYALQDNRKQEAATDLRGSYTKTGAYRYAIGCDIWIVSTHTGETHNLTNGEGTSWSPVWSPDGNYLAFYSDRDGFARLWVWDRHGNTIRRVTDAIVRPRFEFDTVQWFPDSHHIVTKVSDGIKVDEAADLALGSPKQTASDARSGPTVQLYSVVTEHRPTMANTPRSDDTDLAVIDIKSDQLTRTVHGGRIAGYWVSPDGRTIAYTLDKGPRPNTQQQQYELRLVPVSGGTPNVLVANLEQDYGIAVSWSPNSLSLAYTTAGPLAAGDCYVVSVKGGEPRKLSPGTHPPFGQSYRSPAWDSKGLSLFLFGPEAYGRHGSNGIWRASVDQATLTQIATVPGTVLNIVGPAAGGRAWSPKGTQTLTVSARDEGTKSVGFFRIDLNAGSVSKLYVAPAVFGDEFTTDVDLEHNRLIYAFQDATHPPDIWVADGELHDRRRITTINPQLGNKQFGQSMIVEWADPEGQRLAGALLLPPNYIQGNRYPLIVRLYGGSNLSESAYQFGLSPYPIDDMQILATRGYAVFLPDTPLRTGTPMRDVFTTVLPGIDRVIEMGIADPNRLGVMGHSYGGYSTLSLLVQTTRFRAAIDAAGTVDLVSLYTQMRNTGEAFGIGWSETGQGRMGGSPWEYPQRYIDNSPIFYLNRVTTPLLVIQGALDNTVFPSQSDAVFVSLRRLGKDVVYAKYAGEDHWPGTWRFVNALDYWSRVVEWFDGHLKK